MLKDQFEYMNAEEDNPFEADESDIAEACPNELLIDEDEEGNEDIDIMWLWRNFVFDLGEHKKCVCRNHSVILLSLLELLRHPAKLNKRPLE